MITLLRIEIAQPLQRAAMLGLRLREIALGVFELFARDHFRFVKLFRARVRLFLQLQIGARFRDVGRSLREVGRIDFDERLSGGHGIARLHEDFRHATGDR